VTNILRQRSVETVNLNLFSQFPVIQTNQLTLRKIEPEEDAADLYAFYSDPLVIRYLDWEGPSSLEESKVLIESWNRCFEEKKLIPWGICLHDCRQLIGTIMFMPTRGTFEEVPLYPLTLGFDLNHDYWNKGIMTEALNAVITFAKENIGPHRIQAEVVPENSASLRVLKKLGFTEEGLLKQFLKHEVSKTFLDVIVLALIFSS
jgi:ribosomal-protein-alanine N-acetyltransferase